MRRCINGNMTSLYSLVVQRCSRAVGSLHHENLSKVSTVCRLVHDQRLFLARSAYVTPPYFYTCSQFISTSGIAKPAADATVDESKLAMLREDSLSRDHYQDADCGSNSPYSLVQSQIDDIYRTIPEVLAVDFPALTDLASYYFLGSRGKAFRPMVILLIASLCNKIALRTIDSKQAARNFQSIKDPMEKQKRLAMICEMIHTASLIHDDVIDSSDVRRGQLTLHKVAGEKKAILTGDYILAVCCKILADLRNPDVIVCVAQIVEDLVKGELVQMSQSFVAPDKRFDQYLHKTYLKTASLIANSSKAAAIFAHAAATQHPAQSSSESADKLPNEDDKSLQLQNLCYSFGKNIGMAFQIVDDLLDYAATEKALGKPAAGADLRMGIATAPVLFAADSIPNSLIHERMSRRFTGPDDYRLTFAEVMQSDALERTRDLARSYVDSARADLKALAALSESGFCAGYEIAPGDADIKTELLALHQVCDMTLNRDR